MVSAMIGGVCVFLAFIGFIPYFMSCLKKEIKPHMFSWLLWSITGFAVYFGQQDHDPGAGAWVILAESMMCLVVSMFAIFWGEYHFTKSDWWSLAFAMVGIVIFAISDNAALAIFVLSMVDIIAFYPTIRKSWHNPHEEQTTLYSISVVSLLLSCAALNTYDFVTLFNLVLLAMVQIALIAVIHYRRRALEEPAVPLLLEAKPAYQRY